MRLQLEGATKRYSNGGGFGPLNLTLGTGIVGLLGINGAGKSTLMRVLSGEISLEHGTINNRSQNVGYMPQNFTFPAGMGVSEFVEFVLWARGTKSRRKAVSLSALEAVGLEDRASDHASKLSGGMQRRLLFAQAIASGPELLLLDEPTTGLDPEQRIHMRQLIRSHADGTVLLSSHLLEDVRELSERTIVLEAGNITFDGTWDDLLALAPNSPNTGVSVEEQAFLHARQGKHHD